MLWLFLIFLYRVSGESEKVSVMEGDSVTLLSDLTKIENEDTILWLFGRGDSLIAQIGRKIGLTSFSVTEDEPFRGRVQVSQETGSLTIRNCRIRHSGAYKLSIHQTRQSSMKEFNVTVQAVDGDSEAVRSESVSVTEGRSVTLRADSEKHGDALMLWRFGDKGILLAKIDLETKHTSLNEDDERFKDVLTLDNQTGSLTIMNTRTEHAGLYEVQMRGSESSQRFLLSVSDPGLSSGAKAGIWAVALVAVLLLVAVVMYYRRRISKLKQKGEEKKISAKEGDSPTLPSNLTERHGEKIQWCYEVESNLIAQIDGDKRETYNGADGRFRSKLRLDGSGNLIISNIRTIHSGIYKLKISGNRGKTKHTRVMLSVDVKEMAVTAGRSVTLPGAAAIQPNSLLLWTFRAENSLVASNAANIETDERFRGRVELNENTGSLTVRNIRTSDSGHYKLQIINSKQTTFSRFSVTVTKSSGNPANQSGNVRSPLLNGADEQNTPL